MGEVRHDGTTKEEVSTHRVLELEHLPLCVGVLDPLAQIAPRHCVTHPRYILHLRLQRSQLLGYHPLTLLDLAVLLNGDRLGRGGWRGVRDHGARCAAAALYGVGASREDVKGVQDGGHLRVGWAIERRNGGERETLLVDAKYRNKVRQEIRSLRTVGCHEQQYWGDGEETRNWLFLESRM